MLYFVFVFFWFTVVPWKKILLFFAVVFFFFCCGSFCGGCVFSNDVSEEGRESVAFSPRGIYHDATASEKKNFYHSSTTSSPIRFIFFFDAFLLRGKNWTAVRTEQQQKKIFFFWLVGRRRKQCPKKKIRTLTKRPDSTGGLSLAGNIICEGHSQIDLFFFLSGKLRIK